MAKRKIYCLDAIEWLSGQSNLGSIVTSLPDLEETGFNERDYLDFFKGAILACLSATSRNHPTVFYQTDRLFKGRRISKAAMILQVATNQGLDIVWHKIMLRRDPGKIDLRRPGYTHLIAVGDPGVKAGKATPDVMQRGSVLYPNGMGLSAATMALRLAKAHGDRVCDPFCGRGTVLAVAEAMGFKRIVGVDIDPAQCEAAAKTRLNASGLTPTELKPFFIGE